MHLCILTRTRGIVTPVPNWLCREAGDRASGGGQGREGWHAGERIAMYTGSSDLWTTIAETTSVRVIRPLQRASQDVRPDH